ncbi:MAG: hypothetical protein Kow00124_02340 [Anaerolineae bacterium]
MRVELRNIHKYFGDVRANEGINLTFEPGRIYGLLGENGAGKSTLMKILSGYQPPTMGEIVLDGEPVVFSSPSDALQRGIGMLYQEPKDFPPLRAVENHLLAYDDRLPLALREGCSQLSEIGERFGFENEPMAYLDTLTLGERQQIELLRQLALGAEFLILDEPTTGISAEQKDILFDTMRRLAHEDQKTIVLVSHKLEEVHELCDAVAVLRKGQLVGTLDLPCATEDLVQMMFGQSIVRSERARFTERPTVLSVEDATIHTYRLTVEDINLELREGEVLGLAGLEGSGQKLLLQACAGLLPLRKGQIRLDGWVVQGKRSPLAAVRWLALGYFAVRAIWLLIRLLQGQIGGLQTTGGILVALLVAGAMWLVGIILDIWTRQEAYHAFIQHGGAYVPAGRLEEGLVTGMTLAEHMTLVDPEPGFVIDRARYEEQIAKRIERYGIIGRPTTKVEELSGGNQQRAMLGLLKSPLRLLLLEHPTRGLDITSTNWIWQLFQERREEGTAIMFISADLDELLERSDRIAVFSGGELLRIVDSRETSVEELGYLIGGKTDA